MGPWIESGDGRRRSVETDGKHRDAFGHLECPLEGGDLVSSGMSASDRADPVVSHVHGEQPKDDAAAQDHPFVVDLDRAEDLAGRDRVEEMPFADEQIGRYEVQRGCVVGERHPSAGSRFVCGQRRASADPEMPEAEAFVVELAQEARRERGYTTEPECLQNPPVGVEA